MKPEAYVYKDPAAKIPYLAIQVCDKPPGGLKVTFYCKIPPPGQDIGCLELIGMDVDISDGGVPPTYVRVASLCLEGLQDKSTYALFRGYLLDPLLAITTQTIDNCYTAQNIPIKK